MKTETSIARRWTEGTPHHLRSVDLYKLIEAADFRFASDSFCFKSGGDGDNGESLMYLLDIIFEAEDNGDSTKEEEAADVLVVFLSLCGAYGIDMRAVVHAFQDKLGAILAGAVGAGPEVNHG